MCHTAKKNSIFTYSLSWCSHENAMRLHFLFLLLLKVALSEASVRVVQIFSHWMNNCSCEILLLLLFLKIPPQLPKWNHPKRSASTRAVAVCVAAQRCVLWSTPGPWFLLCLGSWESTELNTRTTMLLEIWWGSCMYPQRPTEIMQEGIFSCGWHVCFILS